MVPVGNETDRVQESTVPRASPTQKTLVHIKVRSNDKRMRIIEHQLWNIVLGYQYTPDLLTITTMHLTRMSNGEDKSGLSRRSEAREWARFTREKHGIRTHER